MMMKSVHIFPKTVPAKEKLQQNPKEKKAACINLSKLWEPGRENYCHIWWGVLGRSVIIANDFAAAAPHFTPHVYGSKIPWHAAHLYNRTPTSHCISLITHISAHINEQRQGVFEIKNNCHQLINNILLFIKENNARLSINNTRK